MTRKKWSLKISELVNGLVHMTFPMTGHEKADFLIQVTA